VKRRTVKLVFGSGGQNDTSAYCKGLGGLGLMRKTREEKRRFKFGKKEVSRSTETSIFLVCQAMCVDSHWPLSSSKRIQHGMNRMRPTYVTVIMLSTTVDLC
jgi:hypothetical protein